MMDILEKINEAKTPLKYNGFEQYYLDLDTGWGKNQQWIFKFDNDYGASVVKHYGSYGFEDDLFELAVVFFEDKHNFKITYNTPITSDVIGHLNNEEVLEILKNIKKL